MGDVSQHFMSAGEILASIMATVFALAFAAWAKRLDKALDLLEKIQEQMHHDAVRTEGRLTRLEQIARTCGKHFRDDSPAGDE